MVRNERKSTLARLFSSRNTDSTDDRTRRAEEKLRAASEAIDQWLSLLRELEQTGESDSARYDTYYRAYLQAREQEKRAELELFNLQHELAG